MDSALVACANIIPAVESIYYWKGKVETSAESLAIFKLTAARYSDFESRLRELHPYDIPEIVRLNIAGGSVEYLRWIGESCSRSLRRVALVAPVTGPGLATGGDKNCDTEGVGEAAGGKNLAGEG